MSDHVTIRIRAPSAGPVERILIERRRQIEAEGYSLEHDDQHDGAELAQAAAAYAMVGATNANLRAEKASACWPPGWSAVACDDTPERALVKAGALIVAELERLERLKSP